MSDLRKKTGGSATWTPQGPTLVTVGGITAGTNLGVIPVLDASTLTQMFYPYTSPTVSLVLTPAAGLREFGDNVAATILAPTTVKHSNPITTLTLSRSGVGVIKTYVGPNPNGAAEAPYTDIGGAVSATTTYTATVGDGTSTGTGTGTYTFIYPFFYGVGAPGLNAAGIVALTKLLETQGNKTKLFSPVAQVYYFAYPATYPNLNKIFDGNGFDITADWTLHNPVALTSGAPVWGPVNFKVYEFNNVNSTVQNLTFTF